MYKIKNFFIILPIILATVLNPYFYIHAQSAESINFTTSLDKTSVYNNDSFNVNYTITNNSTTNIYNVTFFLDYLDQILGADYLSNSQDASVSSLKTTGYVIASNIDPQKSYNFSVTYHTNTSTASNGKIISKITNTPELKSVAKFAFDSASNAPVFTKNNSINLPTIAATAAGVASIKYPFGFTGTDLSKLDSNTAKSVSGFFIQNRDTKITYTENLDLSTQEAVDTLKNLTQNFDFNFTGAINLPINNTFNKKATVEMQNLIFTDTPILFFNADKYTKPIKFDAVKKTATFDVDGGGKFTLMGEVKIEIPSQITNKYLELAGKVTDPSAKIIPSIGDKKLQPMVVDLSTGNFKFTNSFDTSGPLDITFEVFAKNGVSNKQKFNTTVLEIGQTTSIVTPTSTETPPNEKTYINLLMLILGGIILFFVLLIGFLTYFSLKKKKKDPTSFDIDKETELPEIEKFDSSTNLKDNDTSSENRHEIIRSKLEDSINEEENNNIREDNKEVKDVQL